jgi:hypothetical protein
MYRLIERFLNIKASDIIYGLGLSIFPLVVANHYPGAQVMSYARPSIVLWLADDRIGNRNRASRYATRQEKKREVFLETGRSRIAWRPEARLQYC